MKNSKTISNVKGKKITSNKGKSVKGGAILQYPWGGAHAPGHPEFPYMGITIGEGL